MDIFSERDWRDFSLGIRERIRSEVAAEQPDRLLGMDEQEYTAYLESKYQFSPIRFQMDQRTASPKEVMVPADRFPGNFHVRRGESYPRQAVTIHVPFTGSKELLSLRPTEWLMSTRLVSCRDASISFEVIDFGEDGLKREVESTCDFLVKQAANLERDVLAWNSNVRNIASQFVRERKNEHLQRTKSLSALGIPLAQSRSVPATFEVPVKVKSIERLKPASSPGTFQPDPTMKDADYDRILSVISETGQALERTPAVHTTQSEEGIRDHLLMVLSTHYENASGETFRQRGKTDLLVPYQDGALFVAEVKVWSGPKSLSDAIGQLLSYLTWRDSKAALIVLVRQQGFSEILTQVPAIVRAHPQWSSDVTGGEAVARFGYKLSLPQDPSRKVRLTVLLFHLPDVPQIRTRRKAKAEEK